MNERVKTFFLLAGSTTILAFLIFSFYSLITRHNDLAEMKQDMKQMKSFVACIHASIETIQDCLDEELYRGEPPVLTLGKGG